MLVTHYTASSSNPLSNILVRISIASLVLFFLMLVPLDANVAHGKPPVLVRAITVTQQEYSNTITLTGEVVARNSLNLSFRTSGKISRILVKSGEHVSAGTVLAQLDSQLQNEDVVAAKASVRSAQSQLILARSEYERSKELLDQGFSTRALFDRSEVVLKLATGAVESTSVQLELAQRTLAFMELKAPVGGTITQSYSEEGQIAQAAQPIFALTANGARDAVFDVFESVFLQENTDFEIELSLVENAEVNSDCILREVSPVINPATGTVRVNCGIISPPPGLTLGSVVSGKALLPSSLLFVVPWESMTSDSGKPAVWVLDAETNTVSIRAIEVDRYETEIILVSGGISEGELIVTEGANFLREGMAVELFARKEE